MNRIRFLVIPVLLASLFLLPAGCRLAAPSPTGPAATATSQSLAPTPKSTSTPASSPAPTHVPTPTPSPANSSSPPLSGNVRSEQAEKWVAAVSAEVIGALRDKNMKKLAGFVHPELGVRFSPYAFVNKKTDLVFSAVQLENLMQDTTKRTWGSFDGSGEPITLSFPEYYARFVYNQDFAKPEQISYNNPIGEGNTANNQREIYPDAIIVEYYFSGFDPKLFGNDWASLKLAYENFKGQWKLVGIVHDQWTI